MPQPRQAANFSCSRGCPVRLLKFADKLELFRRGKGLTLSALAEKSRVKPDTLENIQQGRNAPSAANFLRIIRALEVSPEAFDPEDLEVES